MITQSTDGKYHFSFLDFDRSTIENTQNLPAEIYETTAAYISTNEEIFRKIAVENGIHIYFTNIRRYIDDRAIAGVEVTIKPFS